jgi:hypothetical protein
VTDVIQQYSNKGSERRRGRPETRTQASQNVGAHGKKRKATKERKKSNKPNLHGSVSDPIQFVYAFPFFMCHFLHF